MRDRAELRAGEEEQAEGVLKAHLTSLGEQFGKLDLIKHSGHNWFEFHNRLAGTYWVLDANPTGGINHWRVSRKG